jgi:putative membrane protein
MTSERARTRCVYLALGVLSMLGILSPPIHDLAQASVAAHMVQHLVLILVSAPLMAAGGAGAMSLAALSAGSRRRIVHWTRPAWRAHRHTGALALGAWTTHVVVLWLWHTPRLYGLALDSGWAHAFEHASFVLTAWAFWLPVVSIRARRALGPGVLLVYLFAAAGQGTVLGALMALSDAPWYPGHTAGNALGLTALDDQRLAGLLMWIPGGIGYGCAALVVLGRVLASAGRDVGAATEVSR